jgi:hypothetical protein
MAKLPHGANQHKKEETSIDVCSIDDAATLLNVSPASVDRAKKVLDSGSKPLVEAVERGDVTINRG